MRGYTLVSSAESNVIVAMNSFFTQCALRKQSRVGDALFARANPSVPADQAGNWSKWRGSNSLFRLGKPTFCRLNYICKLQDIFVIGCLALPQLFWENSKALLYERKVVRLGGIEPKPTPWLKVRCSSYWAKVAYVTLEFAYKTLICLTYYIVCTIFLRRCPKPHKAFLHM